MKSILCKLSELIRQALPNLKAELSSLKDTSSREREEILKHYESLTESLEKMHLERRMREQIDLATCRQELMCKIEELKCLHNENTSLENQFKTCMAENISLKNELDKLKAAAATESAQEEEREKMMKDLRETLARDHRAELDSLRSRFKLMIDQSPTDVNQDRLDQFREDFESKKAEAVENALIVERNKWEHVLKDTIAKITKVRDDERKRLLKENDEKERQLNTLRLEIDALREAQAEHSSLTESNKVDEMAASVGLFEGKFS